MRMREFTWVCIAPFFHEILRCADGGCIRHEHQLTLFTRHFCCLPSHLLFFGIKLEALVKGATVLLQVLLLLVPDAVCVLHHLLLDAAKQTEANISNQWQNFVYAFRCKTGLAWFLTVLGGEGDTLDHRHLIKLWVCVSLVSRVLFWKNKPAQCLPFLGSVFPLDNKLHMRWSPWATEFQSSMVQEEKKTTVQIYTHLSVILILSQQTELLWWQWVFLYLGSFIVSLFYSTHIDSGSRQTHTNHSWPCIMHYLANTCCEVAKCSFCISGINFTASTQITSVFHRQTAWSGGSHDNFDLFWAGADLADHCW